jgi:hypothetical protein
VFKIYLSVRGVLKYGLRYYFRRQRSVCKMPRRLPVTPVVPLGINDIVHLIGLKLLMTSFSF